MKQTGKIPNIIVGQVGSLSIGDTFIYNKTLYLVTNIEEKGNNAEVFDLTNQQKAIIPKSIHCVKAKVTFALEGIEF